MRSQYPGNRSLPISSKDDHDHIWTNPNELDLLEMNASSISFLQVSPSIRRLFTIFNSICPHMYRIHCSDSWRIFNEILCLTGEYLHISPPSDISTSEILNNEKYFEDFISKLRRPSIIRRKYNPSVKTDFHCFGTGIQTNNHKNELNQTIFFCFEWTTLTIHHCSSPIEVCIFDPDEKIVPVAVKYINTYNQGHTKLFSCSYTPTNTAGNYRISFSSKQIPLIHEDYTVFIRQSPSNCYSSSAQQQQLVSNETTKKTQLIFLSDEYD